MRFGFFVAVALLATVLPRDVRADSGDRRDDFAAPKVNEGAIPEHKFVADPQKAILVTGLAATGGHSKSDVIRLQFRRYDPTANKFVKTGAGMFIDKFTLSRQVRNPLFFGADIDPTAIVYSVAQIPAGDYLLSDYINVWGGRNQQVTQLMRKGGDDVPSDWHGPRIFLAPGEVVYIGTFRLDVMGMPARLAGYSREDGPAKDALSHLPELQPKFVYRKPTVPKQQ